MTRRVLPLVLLLVLVAAAAAWQLGWLAPTPAPVAAVPTPTPLPRFQSVWATEEEWLVDNITREIRAMAALASTRTLPPADAPAVKPEAIRFQEHLFSPGGYLAIARAALGETRAGGEGGDPREDARLIAALLEPRTAVLVSEDLALSQHLEVEPRDPAAHERAALLLGAFALRDSARDSIGSASGAHVSRGAPRARTGPARGEAQPGAAGRLAETLLVTLLGRERDAVARLDAIASAAPSAAEQSLGRAPCACATPATGGSRATKSGSRCSRRSRSSARSSSARTTTWPSPGSIPGSPSMIPDWGRLALSAKVPSVGTSNRFADLQLADGPGGGDGGADPPARGPERRGELLRSVEREADRVDPRGRARDSLRSPCWVGGCGRTASSATSCST